MSFQELIDFGNSYGYMAISMVELCENYQQKEYYYPARLPQSVCSFLEKVSSGLNGYASTEEIAHYRLACDALVHYNSMSDENAREPWRN